MTSFAFGRIINKREVKHLEDESGNDVRVQLVYQRRHHRSMRSLVASVPLTNYNVPGTFDCGQILYTLVGSPASSHCGIFATQTAFGGCGRMDVDEASGLVFAQYVK